MSTERRALRAKRICAAQLIRAFWPRGGAIQSGLRRSFRVKTHAAIFLNAFAATVAYKLVYSLLERRFE